MFFSTGFSGDARAFSLDFWLKRVGIALENGVNGEAFIVWIFSVISTVATVTMRTAAETLRKALAIKLETFGIFAVAAPLYSYVPVAVNAILRVLNVVGFGIVRIGRS